MVFKNLTEPVSVSRVRIFDGAPNGTVHLVTGWSSAGDGTPVPALVAQVEDSGAFGLQPEGFSCLLRIFGALGKSLLFSGVLLGEAVLFVSAWRWPRRNAVPVLTQAAVAAMIVAIVLLVATAGLVALTPAGL